MGRRTLSWRRREKSSGSRTRGCNRLTRRITSTLLGAPRPYLKGPGGRSPQPDEFALAVNSALTRSQDQLHIYLGCLLPAINHRLSTLAYGLPIGVWTRVRGLIPGSVLWGLRTGRHDLAGVEPFRLAAEGLRDKIRDRAQLTIFVTGVRLADEELPILASEAKRPSRATRSGLMTSLISPVQPGRDYLA